MENIAEVINQKTGGNAQTIAETMAQWNPSGGGGWRTSYPELLGRPVLSYCHRDRVRRHQ